MLDQDAGADRMQIYVIDDASTSVNVGGLVQAFASNRISYMRQPRNLGLAANWNTCIAKAQGEPIHILHHDDLVYPAIGWHSSKGLT